jgi:hypothetical protein
MVFVLTALVFLSSALLVARVRLEPARDAAVGKPAGIARDAVAGFRTILSAPDLRVLVGLYAAQAFVGGAFNVLLVVSALELLDLGQSGVGFLNAAFGVGGVLGAVVALALLARRRLASDFMLGIALWGAPLMLIGIWPNAAAAIVLLGLIGIGETLVEVAGPTLLQRSVPDAVLARVFGALESLIVTMIGLGGRRDARRDRAGRRPRCARLRRDPAAVARGGRVAAARRDRPRARATAARARALTRRADLRAASQFRARAGGRRAAGGEPRGRRAGDPRG